MAFKIVQPKCTHVFSADDVEIGIYCCRPNSTEAIDYTGIGFK